MLATFMNVTPDVCSRTTFTLANRDWHFFDVMAGSEPRWVTAKAGMVETGEVISGPGRTMLSLGSSAG